MNEAGKKNKTIDIQHSRASNAHALWTPYTIFWGSTQFTMQAPWSSSKMFVGLSDSLSEKDLVRSSEGVCRGVGGGESEARLWGREVEARLHSWF